MPRQRVAALESTSPTRIYPAEDLSELTCVARWCGDDLDSFDWALGQVDDDLEKREIGRTTCVDDPVLLMFVTRWCGDGLDSLDMGPGQVDGGLEKRRL